MPGVKRPQTNGFAERFHRTAPDEFYRIVLREKVYPAIEALQDGLDKWLKHYNRERPHLGHRSDGRTPYGTVQRFIPPPVKQAA